MKKNYQPISFMKKISIVLVSMVYMLPGVLAVLAHTRVIDSFNESSPAITETQYSVTDSLQSQDDDRFLVMLDRRLVDK